MGMTSLDSMQAGKALQDMANSVRTLNDSAKNYINSLENDIFANLSGNAITKFIEQTKTQCNNLATVTQNLENVTVQLINLKNKMTADATTMSRGGI